MIRSTPGYILIENGIVKKKWHQNDMPTVDELCKLVGPQANVAPMALEPTNADGSNAPEPKASETGK